MIQKSKEFFCEQIKRKYSEDFLEYILIDLNFNNNIKFDLENFAHIYPYIDFIRRSIELNLINNIELKRRCALALCDFDKLLQAVNLIDWKSLNAARRVMSFTPDAPQREVLDIKFYNQSAKDYVIDGINEINFIVNNEKSIVARYIINNVVPNKTNINVFIMPTKTKKPLKSVISTGIRSRINWSRIRGRGYYLGRMTKSQNIPATVREICDVKGYRNHSLTNFSHDHQKILSSIQKSSIFVFLGNQIVPRWFIESVRGVVHLHPGWIPNYRGYESVEWACLEKRFDQIGPTLQLMAAELDAGSIIKRRIINIHENWNISAVRSSVLYHGILAMQECLNDICEGKTLHADATHQISPQCFLMHPKLRKIAEKNLADFGSRLPLTENS